eukprot:jgi/Chlat1/1175/Chrsp113S01639
MAAAAVNEEVVEVSKEVAGQRRRELRRAVADLRRRGLYEGAKWAAEQLVGLGLPQQQRGVDESEKASTAGEKRKEEEVIEVAGPTGRGEQNVVNRQLPALESELTHLHKTGQADAFCTFLYGLVLRDLGRSSDSRSALCASVSAYPCNWPAWQALTGLPATDRRVVEGMTLENHWMRGFFTAAVSLELQHNTEGLAQYQALKEEFPGSDYVLAQTAAAHYHLRDFDQAEVLFQDLLQSDPHRVEGMDTYSNILYVKEDLPALSHLAHRVVVTDKYRPETCCIVGNYYSLRSLHEKAVTYFQRALKLDRRYLSAYTLMGHEYVELKNTAAAIEAYRRAVDVNARDYRAWYGLGQTYELLAMPYYALYYYRRATELRPQDARMWCAMGQCYEHEQLGMHAAAIRCYRRALSHDDREGLALHKLAGLHAALSQSSHAAFYYKANLRRLDAHGAHGQDLVDALKYLAVYHRNRTDLSEAEHYCLRLLDASVGAGAGPEKEDAKALLREIRSIQQHGGHAVSRGGATPTRLMLSPLPDHAAAMMMPVHGGGDNMYSHVTPVRGAGGTTGEGLSPEGYVGSPVPDMDESLSP